jgi:amino acid transporter
LFGWAQLTVVMTASIGAMAFVFADYTVRIWGTAAGGNGGTSSWPAIVAIAAVAVLSLANIAGAAAGRRVQNLLSVLKVVGLGAIIVAGFAWGSADPWSAPQEAAPTSLGLAMILVLYTYGGWNDAAFVAAEVRNPSRNIPRALLLGVGAITAIYVLVNAAYLWGLGYAAASQSDAIAADLLAVGLGRFGASGMCLIVMLSALAACNGLIFSGSRVYSRLGSEHAAFARLGRWHPRLGVPLWSLVLQAAVSIAMIAVIGTGMGQRLVNVLMSGMGLEPTTWTGRGGFETLVVCSAPVFWTFFLLTGVSLFVLRRRDSERTRPFRVPLYPWVPLAFCATCTWMLYNSITYVVARQLTSSFLLLAIVPLVAGFPVFALTRGRGSSSPQPE